MSATVQGRTLVSVAEAGRAVDVHARTIRRYIATGLITGYRVGPRLLKVDLDEVMRVLVRPIPTAKGNP